MVVLYFTKRFVFLLNFIPKDLNWYFCGSHFLIAVLIEVLIKITSPSQVGQEELIFKLQNS